MLNESTIKTFLMLSRLGSVSEAANQLYLSPQAVRKQIAQMEQTLGYTLLQRERGRLTLTEVGEIYYKAFTQTESIISAAHREAERKTAGWSNRLVIGQPELLDLQDASHSLLRKFQADHPDIQMSYRSAPLPDVLSWLADGQIDIAFALDNEIRGMEGIAHLEIEQLEELLVVSAHHPKAVPGATYLDFQNEPVFFTPDPDGSDADFRARLESIGFHTDKLVPMENLLSSCAAVEQMQGVNFLLENCRMLSSKTFRAYSTHRNITMVLAWRKDNRKRAVRYLAEVAAQQLKKQ